MCESPSILYTDGTINPKTGKRLFKFRSFNLELLERLKKYKTDWRLNYDYFLVPCGHCTECRLKYRKEWSLRLLNELEMSDNAYFLTITYDDDHIPPSKSLKKDDLIRFMKSLYKAIERFYKDNKIKNYKPFRYFACGEYGGDYDDLKKGNFENCRCHYHAIVFNVPFNDFTKNIECVDGSIIHKKSHDGSDLLQSKTLDHIWSKGFLYAGEVNYHSCSYVAGYVQKKLYGDYAQVYYDNFILPPFLICSKGIGSSYFVANKDKLIDTDEVFYMKDGSIHKASIPRYYLKLLEKEDIINVQYIKSMRFRRDSTIDELLTMPYKDVSHFFHNKKLANARKVKRLIRK